MSHSEVPGLTGRVVLVTGAGRGLGHALVLRLIEAGANVLACVRSKADVARVAAESRSVADRVFGDDGRDHVAVVAADVADAAAMEDAAAVATDHWGAVHGAIANASVLDPRVPLRDVDPKEWRRVIDVNLTGAFNTCRAVLPAMRREGGGSIIAVSSGVGDRPRRDWGAYGISKRALEAFAQSLALEEEEGGVRVNVVDPGAMRTSMRRSAYPDEDPATLPRPEEHLGVYLWLLEPTNTVTGRRFAARDWRAPS